MLIAFKNRLKYDTDNLFYLSITVINGYRKFYDGYITFYIYCNY